MDRRQRLDVVIDEEQAADDQQFDREEGPGSASQPPARRGQRSHGAPREGVGTQRRYAVVGSEIAQTARPQTRQPAASESGSRAPRATRSIAAAYESSVRRIV